jgi:integrase
MKTKLTKRTIDAASYPHGPDSKKAQYLWDTALKGFGLRIYPSGRRAYLISYYTKDGRRRFHTFDDHGALTPDEARELAKDKLGDVAKGRDPADEQQAKREELTMNEAFVLYLERHAKPKKRSWNDDVSRYENHVEPVLGHHRLSAVTSADVAKLHAGFGPEHGALANRVLSLIGIIYRCCEQWGLAPRGSNPAHGIPRFGEQARERWLSGEEVARLVRAIDEERGFAEPKKPSLSHKAVAALEAAQQPMSTAEVAEAVGHPRTATARLLAQLAQTGRVVRVAYGLYEVGRLLETPEAPLIRAALWLYLLTGVRKSELLQAKWAHVDFTERVLRLPRTKAGRSHTVPLSEPVLAILRNLPRESEHIFPGRVPDRPLNNIDKAWRRIRARAGLDDVRLHDLRRSVGSWLVQAGNSLLVVQKALNHSTYEVSLVYARLNDDVVRRALDEHAERVLAAAGRGPSEVSQS